MIEIADAIQHASFRSKLPQSSQKDDTFYNAVKIQTGQQLLLRNIVLTRHLSPSTQNEGSAQ